jgi:hypothetical protein
LDLRYLKPIASRFPLPKALSAKENSPISPWITSNRAQIEPSNGVKNIFRVASPNCNFYAELPRLKALIDVGTDEKWHGNI